jgi:LacI family transcriptional regulator
MKRSDEFITGTGDAKVVTMKDVAQKADVSLMTVSNVIHGKTKRVSEATVARVQKIIKEMNYVPNMGARSLVHKRSRLIGVVFLVGDMGQRNFLQDPFISELIGSIEKKIHQFEYFMLIHMAADISEIVNLAETWNVEGLIILFTEPAQNHELMATIQKPIVFIDCYFDSADEYYHNVGMDDFQGALIATRYLLEMGHRKILFVHDGPLFDGTAVPRGAGFRQAMEQAGLIVNDENFVLLLANAEREESDWQQLFDRRSEFTALFCTSDRIAIEGMNYFQDRGVEIPRDLSIVGFDDIIYSSKVRPRLTTVHQDVSRKGTEAIKQLVTLIESGSIPVRNVRLPARLVIRDSVRRLAENE